MESQNFTGKQGQYLAYIHAYIRVVGRPPAEADFASFFRVSPPTVHAMILSLERRHWISRVPRQPRSICLLVPPELLPSLK